MLSKQRGFLHFAETYRCHGFCTMSEGSATNAFLKGNVYEIQCRPLLKHSQPYFPRFRWPLDPGSPSPTWQSYITSDFFLHHDCFFFLIMLSCSNPQCVKYSKGNISSIQMAPWPWTSRHRDCLGLQPLGFTSCWDRAAEWLLMGAVNQATKECIRWFGRAGELEKTLILFLGVLEKYWPA